jgi:hypothetical protein
MAGEYVIDHFNGTPWLTVYPLETNGGTSVPRDILSVDSSPKVFTVFGDVTARFINGFTFQVVDSAANDGTYTVASAVYGGSPGITTITTVEVIPSEALPLGYVQYSVPADTSLVISGRGSMNWGQVIQTSLLNMLENFSGAIAPAEPTTGQLWYNTNTPALQVFNGSTWIDISGGTSTISSWRAPVVARDNTLYANFLSFPTTGIIDGVTLVDGDRVLFSNVAAVTQRNVWIWDATGTSWTEDTQNEVAGDAVYVVEGTDSGKVFAFDQFDQWAQISGSGSGGGGNSGIAFIKEQFTASAAQTLFTLTNTYIPSATGVGLLVFVDGIKQVKGLAYDETSSTSITFLGSPTPFVGGEIVECYIVLGVTGTAVPAYETQTGANATGSPPVFDFSIITYVPGANSLSVFFNGQKVVVDVDYVETTPNQIQWIGIPLELTDFFEFYSFYPVLAGTRLEDISNVQILSTPTDGDVLTYDAVDAVWKAEPASGSGAVPPNYEEFVGTGSAIYNTVLDTLAKGAGVAYMQVFVNGVFQQEGGTKQYTVTGANQITFNVSSIPAVSDDVVIYAFAT